MTNEDMKASQKKFRRIVFFGIIAAAIISVVVAFGILTIFDQASNEYSRQEVLHKSKVGKQIVLNNDTMTVVDYSMFDATYTLTSKRTPSLKVSDALVDNQPIISRP